MKIALNFIYTVTIYIYILHFLFLILYKFLLFFFSCANRANLDSFFCNFFTSNLSYQSLLIIDVQMSFVIRGNL